MKEQEFLRMKNNSGAIISISMPALKICHKSAFRDCQALKSIYLPKLEEYYSAICNKTPNVETLVMGTENPKALVSKEPTAHFFDVNNHDCSKITLSLNSVEYNATVSNSTTWKAGSKTYAGFKEIISVP